MTRITHPITKLAGRRQLLLGLGLAPLAAPRLLQAQAWPTRPITLLLSFGPGGATDLAARAIAGPLQQVLGVPVVVENRPGGQHLIAIRRLLSSAPDGQTLYVASGGPMTQSPALRSNPGYDPRSDFTPVARFCVAPGAITVRPDLPARNMVEFVDLARRSSPSLTYGSAGVGGASHLQAEVLSKAIGAPLEHIPFTSDARALLEVMQGRVDIMLSTLGSVLATAREGRVRTLVVTSLQPVSTAAELPTLRDAGVPGLEDLDPYSFFGLVGPAGIPAERVQRLNAAVNDAVAQPEVARQFRETLFNEPVTETPEAFGAFIRREYEKWLTFGRSMQIRLD
jgi:tripartite-type tricarboxylate transporter receptor subunit TctC